MWLCRRCRYVTSVNYALLVDNCGHVSYELFWYNFAYIRHRLFLYLFKVNSLISDCCNLLKVSYSKNSYLITELTQNWALTFCKNWKQIFSSLYLSNIRNSTKLLVHLNFLTFPEMNGIAFSTNCMHGYGPFLIFLKKLTTSAREVYTNFRKILLRNFSPYLSLQPEFLEFSILKLFEFRKFHTFGIFWRFPRKFYYIIWHSLPFLIKFWRICDWKIPYCIFVPFQTFVDLRLLNFTWYVRIILSFWAS